MKEEVFKQKIYGPYGEAWKVIKILAEAEDDNPALGEVLNHYTSEIDKFSEKYKDNEFAQALRSMLLKSDDIVMRMGRV